MIFSTRYTSPAGEITLASDGENLVGAWFEGQRFFGGAFTEMKPAGRARLALFREACVWLDAYFRGEKPSPKELSLSPCGSVFQREVWRALLEIPYGETSTYGEVSGKVAARLGVRRMSARAVGGAIGRNPITVIIPCHRVIGANGKLTGYAGGLERKKFLLRFEQEREI